MGIRVTEDFYSDNGAPCHACTSTIKHYEMDAFDGITKVVCWSCKTVSWMCFQSPVPTTAADISAQERINGSWAHGKKVQS